MIVYILAQDFDTCTIEGGSQTEEILRHHYDVRTEIREEGDSNAICEIEARITRNWITICRFAPDENLKDILTMFKVNFN